MCRFSILSIISPDIGVDIVREGDTPIRLVAALLETLSVIISTTGI